MRRRLAALLTVLLLVSGVAFSKAETAKVEDVSATMGENTVCYPQLSGLQFIGTKEDQRRCGAVGRHCIPFGKAGLRRQPAGRA